MTAYELMIKTNHYLIKGYPLTQSQKSNIVCQLLAAKSESEKLNRFKQGIKAPEYLRALGQTKDTRILYPLFYLPPYQDGKKLKTIFYQMPKTQIFSANQYELEILRLLAIFAPDDSMVKEMLATTLTRLKTTCFGYHDDGLGECFDTSLVVLRFLIAAAPEETEWIADRIANYQRHVTEKKRPWFSLWYYWLCLSELPFDFAEPEIEPYREEILNRLMHKSYVMNSEQDRILHPVLLCVLRNILTKYTEFSYLKEREPHINEKDGRLYFSFQKNLESV